MMSCLPRKCSAVSPLPAQAVGRFALFVAEVQALSFGVDEDDRKVAAVLLAVGAHDVLGALVSVTVVVRVFPRVISAAATTVVTALLYATRGSEGSQVRGYSGRISIMGTVCFRG